MLGNIDTCLIVNKWCCPLSGFPIFHLRKTPVVPDRGLTTKLGGFLIIKGRFLINFPPPAEFNDINKRGAFLVVIGPILR